MGVVGLCQRVPHTADARASPSLLCLRLCASATVCAAAVSDECGRSAHVRAGAGSQCGRRQQPRGRAPHGLPASEVPGGGGVHSHSQRERTERAPDGGAQRRAGVENGRVRRRGRGLQRGRVRARVPLREQPPRAQHARADAGAQQRQEQRGGGGHRKAKGARGAHRGEEKGAVTCAHTQTQPGRRNGPGAQSRPAAFAVPATLTPSRASLPATVVSDLFAAPFLFQPSASSPARC